MRMGFFGGDERRTDTPETFDVTFNRLLGVGLAAAAALFVASLMPAPLVAATLAQLLGVAALAAVLVATIRGDGLPEDCLTGWDQAAMLWALSLLAGRLVDPQAAQQALHSLQEQALAG